MNRECSICLQRIFFARKKLACRHLFHKKCIKDMFKATGRRSCPLCMRYIMAKPETKLLAATTTETIDAIYTLHESNVNPEELIVEAIDYANLTLVSYLLPRVNLNDVVSKLIDTENIHGIELLLSTRKINFHATKQGQTLIERAYATKNSALIHVILNYCGFHHDDDGVKASAAAVPSLYPKIPSAPLF